ncbi:MAG: hypothetical protein STSR0004_06180 [Peptococcaceae bacterium]
MYPVVLADGEEANGLAYLINMLLGQNLSTNPEKQKLAAKMNCTIGIDSIDTEQKVTLTFSPAQLIIKNDFTKPRLITVSATTDHIMEVTQLKVIKNILPVGFLTKRGWQLIKEILAGRFKIKGLIIHPLKVIKFVALVSVSQ